jgi:hypothetical protein
MDKEENDLDSDIPTISFIRIGQSLSPNGEINEEELKKDGVKETVIKLIIGLAENPQFALHY